MTLYVLCPNCCIITEKIYDNIQLKSVRAVKHIRLDNIRLQLGQGVKIFTVHVSITF